MTIPTQMSLHGYIATAPELSFTDTGHARFYCRVGIEQHRKEVDGSFTRLDPVYADLVMFDRTAERGYSRFKPGDRIIASGTSTSTSKSGPASPARSESSSSHAASDTTALGPGTSSTARRRSSPSR
jgi:single-strand DNA-binding protein